MDKYWAIVKYIGFYTGIILLLCCSGFLFGDVHDTLSYTEDLLKDKRTIVTNSSDGEPAEAINAECDDYHLTLAKTYYKFGKIPETFQSYERIILDDNRYRLLRQLIKTHGVIDISNIVPLLVTRTKAIKGLSFRLTLYMELLTNHIKKIPKDQITLLIAEIDELENSFKKNPDDYEFFLASKLELVPILMQSGFNDDAEKVLNTSRTYLLKNREIWFYSYLVGKYIETGQKCKAFAIMAEMEQLSSCDRNQERLFNEALLYLSLGNYRESEKRLDLIVRNFEKKTQERSTLEDVLCFFNDLQFDDTGVLERMLLKTGIALRLKDVILYLVKFRCSADDYPHIWDYEYIQNQIIRFLISFSFFDEAKSMADKLDADYKCRKYNDYFHYYLCYIYMNSETSRVVSNQEHINDYYCRKLPLKIKEYLFLRIGLYLRGADIQLGWKNETDFVELMDREMALLDMGVLKNRGNCALILPGAEHVALKWLEGDFPLRALETVKYIDSVNSRDDVLYQIIQYYIHLGNLEEARKVSKKLSPDSDLKNLITAKIAAHLMCVNKNEDARRLFRSAIKNEIGSKGDYFGKIMDNYVNAVKYKRKIIDNLLFFPSIEKY